MKTLIKSLPLKSAKVSQSKKIKLFSPKKSNQPYSKLKKMVQGLAFQAMSLSFQSKAHQELFVHFAEDLIQLSKISQPIALNHFICRFSKVLIGLKLIDEPLLGSEGVTKNIKQFALILSSVQFSIVDQLNPKWMAVGRAEEWLKSN